MNLDPTLKLDPMDLPGLVVKLNSDSFKVFLQGSSHC
jgi:hypothetical protein